MRIFLVTARLVAEAGMFRCTAHLSWTGIAGILGGLFGFHAIGPQQLMLVTLFVLLVRMTECAYVTPLVISSLEVCRRESVPIAPVARIPCRGPSNQWLRMIRAEDDNVCGCDRFFHARLSVRLHAFARPVADSFA